MLLLALGIWDGGFNLLYYYFSGAGSNNLVVWSGCRDFLSKKSGDDESGKNN